MKRTIAKVGTAENQARALELRLAGRTYRDVASAMGVSVSTVHHYVHDAIAAVTKEPATAVVELELARLDAMLFGCWEDARTGDERKAALVLRIMERRASLLGLDAPKAVVQPSIHDHPDVQRFMARLRSVLRDEHPAAWAAVLEEIDADKRRERGDE